MKEKKRTLKKEVIKEDLDVLAGYFEDTSSKSTNGQLCDSAVTSWDRMSGKGKGYTKGTSLV